MKALQSLKKYDMALRLWFSLVYLQSSSVRRVISLCMNVTVACAYIPLVNGHIDALGRTQPQDGVEDLQSNFLLRSVLITGKQSLLTK